jgi:hypothetical protein
MKAWRQICLVLALVVTWECAACALDCSALSPSRCIDWITENVVEPVFEFLGQAAVAWGYLPHLTFKTLASTSLNQCVARLFASIQRMLGSWTCIDSAANAAMRSPAYQGLSQRTVELTWLATSGAVLVASLIIIHRGINAM